MQSMNIGEMSKLNTPIVTETAEEGRQTYRYLVVGRYGAYGNTYLGVRQNKEDKGEEFVDITLVTSNIEQMLSPNLMTFDSKNEETAAIITQLEKQGIINADGSKDRYLMVDNTKFPIISINSNELPRYQNEENQTIDQLNRYFLHGKHDDNKGALNRVRTDYQRLTKNSRETDPRTDFVGRYAEHVLNTAMGVDHTPFKLSEADKHLLMISSSPQVDGLFKKIKSDSHILASQVNNELDGSKRNRSIEQAFYQKYKRNSKSMVSRKNTNSYSQTKEQPFKKLNKKER